MKKTAPLLIEMRPLSSIKPYPKNPRDNDGAVDAVAESIRQFGFKQPIVVDAKDVIIAGHTRWKAAAKLGLMAVPVHVARDLTPMQVKAYRLVDNKTNEAATWIDALLGEELKGLADFDLTKFDFDQKLIDSALRGLSLGQETEEVESPPDNPKTKPGDLYVLGQHRLLCGDSANPKDVKRVLAGAKVSCVFTDPPYGVSIGKKNRMLNAVQRSGRCLKDIKDDDMKPADLERALLPAFENVRQLAMADDCTVFLTAPQGGELGLMMLQMMQKAGLRIRHVLIWKKNAPTFSMGRLDYDYQHEPILLTWGKRHKRPMKGAYRTSVWEIDKPRASAEHPTMKPVELYTNAYLNNSVSKDFVFEPYAGSGTAFIASELVDRQCRGIEISPAYCDVIVGRWEKLTGEKARLVRRSRKRSKR